MTIQVYKNKTVKVVAKTSHGLSRVQEVMLDPNIQHPIEKWVSVGEQFMVPSQDVRKKEATVPVFTDL